MLDFDNSYARLPERLFARLAPTPVAAPRLLKLNEALAETLGLDAAARDRLGGEAGLANLFSGVSLPDGAEPLAMAYAGHQFGGWVPQLGDGRAILLGETIGSDGLRYDIQLKGAGRTPFSRMGDGRAALGPALREYLISEAMAALGAPTTRALAVVATGEAVQRETPLPGAIFTRVARAHLRVGTFQFFAARQDLDALRALTDYALDRLYPDAVAPEADGETRARALFETVIERQAALIARWMSIGFIHGVMNTDNMSIAGETIDYGPCAFMDAYDPATVFSSIDHMGRYAYQNQPAVAHWNLAMLAQSLLPLLAQEQQAALDYAQPALDRFPELYAAAYLERFREKLGLSGAPDATDGALINELLGLMEAAKADFTLSFRALADLSTSDADDALTAHLGENAAVSDWIARWRARLDAQPGGRDAAATALKAANPALIPRNHQVERALAAATNGLDLAPFEALHAALARPFDDLTPETRAYSEPPQPEERVLATFCGT